MESDSFASAVGLVVALGAFLFVNLAEASLIVWGRQGPPTPTGGTASRLAAYVWQRASSYVEAAAILRLAGTAASTVALVALVVALVGDNWGWIGLATLGLWGVLAGLRAGSHALVARWSPAMRSRWMAATVPVLWPVAPLGRVVTRLRRPQPPTPSEVSLAQDERAAQDASFLAPEEPAEYTPLELDPRERSMIRAILRLGKTTVREIMTPRVDIVAVEVETPLVQVAELMVQGGHSRLPVFEDGMDNVVGVVHARDLMETVVRPGSQDTLRSLVRPAHFAPEFKRVDELLEELQERRIHLAMVVDEYGGIAGLVTLEDLLEEIVGDIVDEFQVEEPAVERVSDNEAVMDARVSLDVVNSTFDSRLSGEGFGTLGGFVYSLLGKMPSPGDEVVSGGLTLRVLSTVGRRIRKVRVVRAERGPEPQE